MNGLGRFMAMRAMAGETNGRDAEEQWRALHRRPDALPIADDEPGIVRGREARGGEALSLRRLITRFGHR